MRETIAVLFGGQSSEHDVSCMSAVNVIDQIDRGKYNLLLIGITKEGRWLLTESADDIRSGAWREGTVTAVLSPDAVKKCVIMGGNGGGEIPVDVVFPVLHGLYGEDGTVQGLLELARIPYVGSGVLASAVSMDKFYTKIIVKDLGFRQARYVPLTRGELKDMDAAAAKVAETLSYPVFVKPANAGSSCGVSKAGNRAELGAALTEAGRHDRKILVEEAITGREIECAVFGGGQSPMEVSGVGEILTGAEFYDYNAKYCSADSRTVIDPELPAGAAETVRTEAEAVFRAVDGYGLARVDFFVTADGGVIFNEINTMPGFTAISMYPMLWEARGVSKAQLVEKLIRHAKERYGEVSHG